MTPICSHTAFAPWTIASSTAAPASSLLRKMSTISAGGSTSASVATTGAPWIVLPAWPGLTAITLCPCAIRKARTPFDGRAGLGEAPTTAMRRGWLRSSRISPSSLIAMSASLLARVQPVGDLRRYRVEWFAGGIGSRRRRDAAVTREADAHRQRHPAEEVEAHRSRRRLGAAAAEGVADFAAMRTGVTRHILDQPDARHIGLFAIGRASGRERVCQSVSISVVDGSFKKTNKNETP